MSWLDWVLLAVLLFSALLGMWRGLVYEVLSVAGWVAAFVLAQAFAADVGAWLPMGDAAPPLPLAAGFVVVFLATAFGAGLLAWLVKKLVESVGLRPVDRVLGSLFGVLRGVVILLAFAVVVNMLPTKSRQWWQGSPVAEMLTSSLHTLKPLLPEAVAKYLP